MFLQFLKKHRKLVVFVLLITFISVLLEHATPWLLKSVVNAIGAEKLITPIIKQLFLVAFLIIIAGILGYIQRVAVAHLSRNIEKDLRTDTFVALIHQKNDFLQKTPGGDIIQRLVFDLEQVQELLGPTWVHLFRTGLTLFFSTLLIYLLSPLLALYSLIFFVILAGASLKMMKFVYAGQRQSQAASATLANTLRESLLGLETIKNMGIEAWFSQRTQKNARYLRKKQLKVNAISGLIWPTITLLSSGGIGFIIFNGAKLIQQGNLSAGAFAATVLYLVRAQYPLVGLGMMVASWQRGLASLNRVLEFQEEMEEFKLLENSYLHEFKSLRVKNLSYNFKDGEAAIKDISFNLSAGKSLGVVGETGSGKSTLLKVLCGIHNPPPNSVFINGQDIAVAEDYRRLLSFAPQDAVLFSWSVEENLQLDRNFDPELLDFALNASAMQADVAELPQGINSTIGESGTSLSGGQRQRLGLARALLHQRGVLILDDILSAVDPLNEKIIVDGILKRNPQQAVLFVSHRYSALEHFDEILVMKHGRVVEQGSHAELLALNGDYATNWRLQKGGEL